MGDGDRRMKGNTWAIFLPPLHTSPAAALLPSGFQIGLTLGGDLEVDDGSACFERLSGELDVRESPKDRKGQVGHFRGHMDLTFNEDPDLIEEAQGCGFGDGPLNAFGVGPHQTASTQFGAPIPADADGDEAGEVLAFQHSQHRWARGAAGFTIVIRTMGPRRNALTPGGTVVRRIEIPFAESRQEAAPRLRVLGWMEFRQEDRSLLPEFENHRFTQAPHESSSQ